MKIVDARGLNCPQPVILTKKEMENSYNIRTIVDNEIAKQNIERLAKSMDYEIAIEKEQNDYHMYLTKKMDSYKKEDKKTFSNSMALLISSDKLGKGSEELGTMLMKSYLYALTEVKPYPEAILLMNEGVKLATVNEDAVKNLVLLEQAGVEIMVCGTCLDYYGLKDSLKVGIVGNMYGIVEKMNLANKVIHI